MCKIFHENFKWGYGLIIWISLSTQQDLEAEQNERDQQLEQKQNQLQQYKAQLSTSMHHISQVTESIKRGQRQRYDLR